MRKSKKWFVFHGTRAVKGNCHSGCALAFNRKFFAREAPNRIAFPMDKSIQGRCLVVRAKCGLKELLCISTYLAPCQHKVATDTYRTLNFVHNILERAPRRATPVWFSDMNCKFGICEGQLQDTPNYGQYNPGVENAQSVVVKRLLAK